MNLGENRLKIMPHSFPNPYSPQKNKDNLPERNPSYIGTIAPLVEVIQAWMNQIDTFSIQMKMNRLSVSGVGQSQGPNFSITFLPLIELLHGLGTDSY